MVYAELALVRSRPATSTRRRAADARRQATRRGRVKRGEAVFRIPLPEHEIANALLAAGYFAADQMVDHGQVERVLGALLRRWAAKFYSRVTSIRSAAAADKAACGIRRAARATARRGQHTEGPHGGIK
jgi:hypothetical protein